MLRFLFLAPLLVLSAAVPSAPEFPVTLAGEACIFFICSPFEAVLSEDGSAVTDLGSGSWRYVRRTNELQARIETGESWIGVRDGDCFSGPLEIEGLAVGDATLCME